MAARLLWRSDEIGRAGLRAAARADRATPSRPARRDPGCSSTTAPRAPSRHALVLRPPAGARRRARGRQRHACRPGAACACAARRADTWSCSCWSAPKARSGRRLLDRRGAFAPVSASRHVRTRRTRRGRAGRGARGGAVAGAARGRARGRDAAPAVHHRSRSTTLRATRPSTPTRPGSAAAPTAGLHFTPELLAALDVERVTLHVGLDTFRPLQTETLEEHVLHGERYHVEPDAWARIRDADRVLAVGTTTTRVLETVARSGRAGGAHDALHHAGLRVPARRCAADQLPPAALDAPRARDGVRRRRARSGSCTASRSPSGTGSTRSATPCSHLSPPLIAAGRKRPSSTTRERCRSPNGKPVALRATVLPHAVRRL